jgi:hypothetical protein
MAFAGGLAVGAVMVWWALERIIAEYERYVGALSARVRQAEVERRALDASLSALRSAVRRNKAQERVSAAR